MALGSHLGVGMVRNLESTSVLSVSDEVRSISIVNEDPLLISITVYLVKDEFVQTVGIFAGI